MTERAGFVREQQKEHQGLRYTIVTVDVGEDPARSMEYWFQRVNKRRENIGREFAGFHRTLGRIETTVRQYGKNRLTIEVGYDDIINWKGGLFIEAETQSGEQALSFLEYCLNKERPNVPVTIIKPTELDIRRTVPTVHQLLRSIDFKLGKAVSIDGRRCTAFETGTIYPGLMWRGMYYGYIEELNSDSIRRSQDF